MYLSYETFFVCCFGVSHDLSVEVNIEGEISVVFYVLLVFVAWIFFSFSNLVSTHIFGFGLL